jgi:methanogenic corrinoid protein MtbC1
MTLEDLRIALIELDEKRTLQLARELIAKGEAAPPSILSTCQNALRVVGERYERQEYYLSALIMVGEIFRRVLELVEPAVDQAPGGRSLGTVLLGTVAGDIHDIGKNMFDTSLRAYGFTVIDLGVNVSPERFLEEVGRHRPDVVGLSGLITRAFESMRATVALLRDNEPELGYRPPVVVGGAIIDSRICKYCGADSWSADAIEGVHICERLVASRYTQGA